MSDIFPFNFKLREERAGNKVITNLNIELLSKIRLEGLIIITKLYTSYLYFIQDPLSTF